MKTHSPPNGPRGGIPESDSAFACFARTNGLRNSYVRRVELQNETCSQVLDWDLFKEISLGAASEQGRGLPLTSNGTLKPREQDIP